MEFPMAVLNLVKWLLYQLFAHSCYRAARKLFLFRNSSSLHKSFPSSSLIPNISSCCLDESIRGSQTLVCDIFGTLIKSQSLFPYFMLVAFEGGSIFRSFFLLVSWPILLSLNHGVRLRAMVFITFCGLKVKDMESVGRAVLPKFYLENVDDRVCEVLGLMGRRVVFTSIPRVMVEGFLKEYMDVDVVVGTELQSSGGYFTGFLTDSGFLVKHKALKEMFPDKKPDVGLGTSSLEDHLFTSLSKEAYVVTNEELKNGNSRMTRKKYPKPLVFHDGRLAFLPTPMATLCMFLWLPLGIVLAIFRLIVGIYLPYKLSILLGCWSGVDIRVIKGSNNGNIEGAQMSKSGHVLYVCTHRTLLDPVFLSTALGKPLIAVTYSLSKTSEWMAPMKTVRLTRDRKKDGETMQTLLREGDLVVCPEGTTCREPYLLRFSSLFAELTDEIVPVAMNTHVSMFYGTTASGLKCLDPIFFLMNPCPSYCVEVLGKVPKEMTCVGGGRTSYEVANYIQKQLADALGFECTNLTRRDKYLMLAGNEGMVHHHKD